MNESSILEYLARLYPQKSLNELKPINEGLSSSKVFLASFNDPEEKVIIKIFPEDYQERMAKEIKILTFLENTSIPSPKIIHFKYNFFNKNGILIETFIEGENFFTILKNNNLKEATLEDLAEALSKIHLLKEIDVWQDKQGENLDKNIWIESVNKRNEKNLQDMKNYEIIKIADIIILHNYLNLFVNYLEKMDIFLCPIHGDFNPRNISISKDGKVNGIFDFELHKVAHNLNELGIVYYWLKFYEKEYLFEKIVKKYGEFIVLDRESNKIINAYYLMQIIGAISFLIKIGQDPLAVERLKRMLSEFLEGLKV